MKVYKKYCYESKDYKDCDTITRACASENNCDYIVEQGLTGLGWIGYLLMPNEKNPEV